jgi:hypothetical protein
LETLWDILFRVWGLVWDNLQAKWGVEVAVEKYEDQRQLHKGTSYFGTIPEGKEQYQQSGHRERVKTEEYRKMYWSTVL